jgi:polysaccharide biosynthesis protein PelF
MMYGKPVIITEHGIYTREREIEIVKSDWIQSYYKDMWIDFFYNLSRCAYTSADAVTTLFERNKNMQVSMGCERDKIQIIVNGVDVDKFSLQENDVRSGPITVGAIIRVVPIKDIETMLNAFSLVSKELENVRFKIIGPYDEDEEYYERCLEVVEELEIPNLEFTGSVNVFEHIHDIDVFALTSISEGQPLSILETMACGKPNVTTDVGCCKELLFGNHDGLGQAGYVVPVMNYVEIARHIVKLCKNPELRHKFGLNGRNRVEQVYNLSEMIRRYEGLYYGVGG